MHYSYILITPSLFLQKFSQRVNKQALRPMRYMRNFAKCWKCSEQTAAQSPYQGYTYRYSRCLWSSEANPQPVCAVNLMASALRHNQVRRRACWQTNPNAMRRASHRGSYQALRQASILDHLQGLQRLILRAWRRPEVHAEELCHQLHPRGPYVDFTSRTIVCNFEWAFISAGCLLTNICTANSERPGQEEDESSLPSIWHVTPRATPDSWF